MRNVPTAQGHLNLAQTISIPTEDLEFFVHFLQKIVRIGIWNRQRLLLCTGFPIYCYSLCQKHSAFSIGNKTGNVRIRVTFRNIRAAIVAVENQKVLHILSVCICSLSYPARNIHAAYCHLWSAPL